MAGFLAGAGHEVSDLNRLEDRRSKGDESHD